MFKKSILYILLIFILFIGFSGEVLGRQEISAGAVYGEEPELVCVYKGFGDILLVKSNAIKYVQYSNRYEIYYNEKVDNPGPNHEDWVRHEGATSVSDSKYKNDNSFSQCPAYADYKGSEYRFYDETSSELAMSGPGTQHPLIPDENDEENEATEEIKPGESGLTCIYVGRPGYGDSHDAVMFTQDANNQITFYINPDNDYPKADDSSWRTTNSATILSDSQYYINDRQNHSANSTVINGYFTQCPAFYSNKGSEYRFYDDKNSKYYGDLNNPLMGGDSSLLVAKETKVVTSNLNSISSCDVEILEKSWLNGTTSSLKNSWTNSCLYYYSYKNGCDIIQLDFSTVEARISVKSNKINEYSTVSADFDAYDISNSYIGGMCPVNLYLFNVTSSFDTSSTKVNRIVVSMTEVSQAIPLAEVESMFTFSRIRQLNDGTLISLVPDESCLDDDYRAEHKEECTDTCEKILTKEVVSYLNFGILAMRISIPLILIGLGIVDFAKGVFSSEDDMKKIQQKFIKRIILGIAFFLIPSVLELLLDIAGTVFGINTDFCGLNISGVSTSGVSD